MVIVEVGFCWRLKMLRQGSLHDDDDDGDDDDDDEDDDDDVFKYM